MNYSFSDFGEKFSHSSGIDLLMQDLGEALHSKEKVYLLGGGNPSRIPELSWIWKELLQSPFATIESFEKLLGDYDSPLGNEILREEIANYFSAITHSSIRKENIALTNGSQNAFFYLMNFFAGPSEKGERKALLPIVPEYIGYRELGVSGPIFRGSLPKIEDLSDHSFKYKVDFSNLPMDKSIGCICVSRPTNPSGNVLTDAEMKKLLELAQEHEIPLLVDNAYGVPFPSIVYTDAQLHFESGMIHVFSLSKLGLPGLRTGVVLAEEETIVRIGRANSVMNLALGNFGQVMLLQLLRSGRLSEISETIVKPFYRKKLDVALQTIEEEWANHFAYKVHKSEGAFFLWVHFPELRISSRELYNLLKQEKVYVIPGEDFFSGMEAEWDHQRQCIRMSVTREDEELKAGIRKIGLLMRKLK